MSQQLIITRPDDWHLHLRDNEVLKDIVPASAQQVKRAIIMPNLRPPITSAKQALEYKQRILDAVPDNLSGFEPLMTLYLTEKTSRQDIIDAKNAGLLACKLYPAGATTNSAAGVNNIHNIYPILDEMQQQGLILLIHGEVSDSNTDIFEREKVFIDKLLIPLRQALPELKIVFEHLTTKDGVDYVISANSLIAATFTPQHLLYNRNALFNGGIHPHLYCLPILKHEQHRKALVQAATSGNKRFFMGTDSAPHAKGDKENSCGCAGCFSAPFALELYAQIFEQAGKLDNLEAFTSFNGADFYGLARNTEKITLIKQSWQIPQTMPYGEKTIVPLCAGEQMNWKLLAN